MEATMGEIAIRVGESLCMAAADARWIGSHLGCYQLDRMEGAGTLSIVACTGVLATVALACWERSHSGGRRGPPPALVTGRRRSTALAAAGERTAEFSPATCNHGASRNRRIHCPTRVQSFGWP